jgi:tetratricopeptide (TPR) repeat protein
MEEFFIKNNYQTYRWTSRVAGGEIDEIKKFINPERKVPVIIFQRASFEPVSPFFRYRLGIGVFDKEQKIIVHDYYFGNNYEISYDDFEKMFLPNARSILAVWPSEELKEIIEEPNHQVAYPARLEAMDKIGDLLVTKRARANQYTMSDEFEKAEELSLYEDYFTDPNFEYLPPALQVFELCFWAVYHNEEPDRMIEIITERILPINHNLDEAPEGWTLTPQAEFVYPYYLLSQAYLKKGERDLAIQTYNEAKQIEVIDKGWYQSILEELEAELFQ